MKDHLPPSAPIRTYHFGTDIPTGEPEDSLADDFVDDDGYLAGILVVVFAAVAVLAVAGLAIWFSTLAVVS